MKRWRITYYINGHSYTDYAYGDTGQQAIAALSDSIGFIHASMSVSSIVEVP